jgi:SAM-dependent methyltransferase
MWNQKFDRDDYFYGIEPNAFIKEQCEGMHLKDAHVMCLGEGEGRNALFLAEKKADVVALDASDIGLAKALHLCKEAGHHISAMHQDLETWEPVCSFYDLIVASYVHLPEPLRSRTFANVIATLKPRGIFVAEYFSIKQLEYKSGGPKMPELLYEIELLRATLDPLDVKIEILEEVITTLDEGPGHQGEACVIRVKLVKDGVESKGCGG